MEFDKDKFDKNLYLTVGILMILGLLIGVVFTFVWVFNPTVLNIKICASGWVAFAIFGAFVPDKKPK